MKNRMRNSLLALALIATFGSCELRASGLHSASQAEPEKKDKPQGGGGAPSREKKSDGSPSTNEKKSKKKDKKDKNDKKGKCNPPS